MSNLYEIYWNKDTGNYVAMCDPGIILEYDIYIYPKKVYVALNGNTLRNTHHSIMVKLRHDGMRNMIKRMRCTKRHFKYYDDDQIRKFHPEFGIEEIDELVNKQTLFARLSV